MKQRKSRKPVTTTLHISLGTDLTSPALYSLLTGHLVKQLLFTRNQLPCHYDDLLAAHIQAKSELEPASRSTRRRGRRADRRRDTFLKEAEALFKGHITDPALFSSDAPTSICFLLGASSSAPREAYEFIFPPITSTAALEHSAAAPAAEKENCSSENNSSATTQAAILLESQCKRILRGFVMETIDLPEGSAADRRCKAFVLVKAHCNSGSAKGGNSAVEVSVPKGFTLKRGWRLKMRRGTYTRVNFHRLSEQHDGSGEGGEQQQGDWYLSKAKLQGLVKPMPKN